jgi:hypothetical protein
LDYKVLVEHLKKEHDMVQQSREQALQAGGEGSDEIEPATPSLPKVKMARADTAVVKLIEHIKNATAK